LIINMPDDFPKILADPVLMKRILINLIENAIEAIPEGGGVKINAIVKGEKAIIEVEDTGIGIPKERMNAIFRPFFTTKPKGLGLGLAVCKKLIDAQGGKISVTSVNGKGTKFKIVIPIKKE
ncbi:MAG: sensor histidine kinase, partial [Candidatus Baldrarchaeia archaeon]